MSARPRYVELQDALLAHMAAAGLRPGDRLPPERELAQGLAVARPTLRRALDALERDGRIVRLQGSGTYLRQPRVDLDVRVLVSFTRGTLGSGLAPGTRVLDVVEEPAGRVQAAALDLSPGAAVWRIERLRTADDLPVALERSWFPVALAPALGQADLEQRSIYELLAFEYGVRLQRAEQELTAVAAVPADADLLGCAPGTPLMAIHRRAFDDAGRPAELADDRFLPERARFHGEAWVA